MSNPYYLGKIKDQIIRFLFVHRQCSAEQLACLIYPDIIMNEFILSIEEIKEAKVKIKKQRERITNELSALRDKKYVTRKLFDIHNRDLYMWTLDPSRINDVLYFLEVKEGEGTGWNEDFGDFGEHDTNIFKFTSDLRAEHKASEVDFAINLKLFERQFKKELMTTDYINNLYAAKKFEREGSGKSLFRPDGEFKVYYDGDSLNIWSWIEIDQGSERGPSLVRKFMLYEDYFRASIAKELPGHIFAVIKTKPGGNGGHRIRFCSFLKAYMMGMPEYAPLFNLVVASKETFIPALLSQIHRDLFQVQLINNLKGLMDVNNNYKGPSFEQTQMMINKVGKILGWVPLFTLTLNDPDNVLLYLYLKFDCYECQGFARLVDFHQKFNLLSKLIGFSTIMKKNIIPVFYSYKEPIGVVDQFLDPKYYEYFVRSIYYSIENNMWYDEELNAMPTRDNPLIYARKYNPHST